MAGMMQPPRIVRKPRPVRRSMDDEVWHVDGTDYLARTVLEEDKIGPIGFIH